LGGWRSISNAAAATMVSGVALGKLGLTVNDG